MALPLKNKNSRNDGSFRLRIFDCAYVAMWLTRSHHSLTWLLEPCTQARMPYSVPGNRLSSVMSCGSVKTPLDHLAFGGCHWFAFPCWLRFFGRARPPAHLHCRAAHAWELIAARFASQPI
jgi:hypothetical protein